MFDPNEHLITLQGKKYLEVRVRLHWLRQEHPDAIITTELLAYSIEQEWALTRATVTIPGGGSATGTAFQRPTTIAKDWFANGETSAIGRALGALGFGTLNAVEFDQGDQVVDAPVERQSSAAANAPIAPLQASNLARPEPPAPQPNRDPDRATNAQYARIHASAKEHGWSKESIRDTTMALWGVESAASLTRHQASLLIDVIDDRLHVVTGADGVARLAKSGEAEALTVAGQLAEATR